MDSSKLVILFLLSVAATHASADEVKDGFIFTMPKTLRQGDMTQFCLTLYGPSQAVVMGLIEQDTGKTVTKFESLYSGGEQTCNKFLVPSQGDYELLLYNETDILHDSVKVKVEGQKQITFVQTDKPIYKPGEKVKFRVLTLMSDLKARIGKIQSIFITDPNDIRVKQFLDVETKGISSHEFQLADQAQLGKWNIEVQVDEGLSEYVQFTVDEYVLPRFDVEITPPPYIMVNDETIEGQVCARYTYGKLVTGFLDLEVCSGAYRPRCVHEVVEISGCYNFSANATELRGPQPQHRYYYHHSSLGNIEIKASVTEAGTGAVVNKTHRGLSERHQPLEIALNDFTNGFFKPGLPFYGEATVTKPDGSPAAGELITITASDYKNNLRFSSNFTTDSSGKLTYALCDSFPEDTASFSIEAAAVLYGESGGQLYQPRGYRQIKQWFSPSLSYIQIPRMEANHKCGERMTLSIPFTTRKNTNTEFYYQVMARGTVIKTGRILHDKSTGHPDMDKAHPPSDMCLQMEEIPTPPPTPAVVLEESEESEEEEEEEEEKEEEEKSEEKSEDMERAEENEEGDSDNDESNENDEDSPPVPVPFPHQNFYTEMEQPIVRSELVSDTVSNFQLDLTITPFMSPRFNLLVYHVLADGEVVADNMVFHVDPCFENEVKMEFNKTTVLPGENIDIKLEGAPGSVCGVGIVDKSVNILGGEHQVTAEKVFEKIEESDWRPGYHNDYMYFGDGSYCEKQINDLEDEMDQERRFGFSYYSNYVDAIQAFKASGYLVLTNLQLETRPCTRNHRVFYGMAVPVAKYGGHQMPDRFKLLKTRSNFPESWLWDIVIVGSATDGFRQLVGYDIFLQRSFASPGLMPAPVALDSRPRPESGGPPPPKPSVRSNFPETWLWDLQIIGENGEAVIEETAPDTITNWVGNAMCIDQEKGFGISPMTSLITFQPFFLSLHLPYAAVRGERLPIIFTVYNYLEKCLHIQISLDLGENFKLHNRKEHRDPVCVCGGKSYSAKFYATPESLGSLPVIAQAEIVPGLCGNSVDIDTQYVGLTDAVKRQMLVKAEGVTQQYTHTSYLCSEDGKSQQENVILPLPDDGTMVKDSARGEVKVIGDIMGPAMNNLDNLVRMPTGCGEQNMVGFVPNILVLKYLTNTGRLTEEIQDKAKKHMEIGYQRELQYRHRDGSFSAFGPRDEAGSVWLTAFVVKSFAQAQPYIFIDQKDMDLSLQFLRLSQLETGCFRETGKVFSSYMMGGLGKSKKEESFTTLTAYVLVALLNANVNKSDPVIVNAVDCIMRGYRTEMKTVDPYTLALVSYAMSLYDPTSRRSLAVFRTLEAKANKDGALKYWSRETAKPEPVNTWCYIAAPSAEVEMTSYALMAYIGFYGKRAVEHAHDVAMWISQQRNQYGGFSSTQDTVIGLNALSEFASQAYSKDGTDLKIDVAGKQLDESFNISDREQNTLLLQTVVIPTLPNELSINTKGRGCALIQSSVQYNKMPKDMGGDKKPSFHLKVTPRLYEKDIDRCDRRTIAIIVGSRGKQEYSNGMSLVTLKMVTSWTPVPESLTKLTSLFPVLGMKRLEYKEEEGLLTFYFDEFTRKPKEFTVDVEQDRELAVSGPKPAEIKVFQYYETDVSVMKSYELKTTCGTKEEIPRNVPEVDPAAPFPVQVRVDFNRAPAPSVDSTDEVCPVCIPIKTVPKNLKEIVCNATAVYQAVSGRNGAMPVKLRQDLRPKKRVKNVNIFTNYEMHPGCDCTLLEKPPKRVLIFVREKVKDKMLKLDSTSLVTLAHKAIIKNVRKIQKSCPLQNDNS